MKNELLQLQEQRDFLRMQLKKNPNDKGFKTLRRLDELFNNLCVEHNVKLSKFGRLV